MKTIFLIGFMCSGKSTLGRAVAEVMDVPFVDLDDYIESRAGRSVREIFATLGEEAFRHMEREALRDVATNRPGTIVACGGGTPCHDGNMELMNRLGHTVWLTAPVDCLAARLQLPEHKAKRPLIAALADDEIPAFVQYHLALREPYYAQAHRHFDATRIETAEETLTTARALARLLQEDA